MKITFVVPVANRHRGDVADLDDASASLLITHGFATPADDTPAAEPSTKDTTSARARRPRRPNTDSPSPRVGDEPAPADRDAGTS